MTRRFLSAAFFFLVMLLVMRGQGASLINATSPHGIIDLEFAGDPTRFREILGGWHLRNVLLNMYLDFLFIAAYTFFFLASHVISGSNKGAGVFKWMAFTAALMDFVENVLLLLALHNGPSDADLLVAAICAAIKFFLVILIVAWLSFLFLKSLYHRLHHIATARL